MSREGFAEHHPGLRQSPLEIDDMNENQLQGKFNELSIRLAKALEEKNTLVAAGIEILMDDIQQRLTEMQTRNVQTNDMLQELADDDNKRNLMN
ncbi:MAG: hypothetical protein KW802_00020 [Candidatus Doudnabacteria bacterium]|nr:hypothetical protein [Candidatus Doudnabacteria bacterium]